MASLPFRGYKIIQHHAMVWSRDRMKRETSVVYVLPSFTESVGKGNCISALGVGGFLGDVQYVIVWDADLVSFSSTSRDSSSI